MAFRILVADDDMDNRAIAEDSLALAGYEVLQAVNGADALDVAVRQRPDLILLDLSLPEITGWEVARTLKERVETRAIPIIAFTAHALAGDDVKAKASGCDDYLAKPCTPVDIRRKVALWLK